MKKALWCGAVAVLLLAAVVAVAQCPPVISKGQTLYVPVYSHIYWGSRGKPFDLAVTLSIRNVDPLAPITVTSVEYYDTEGKRIRTYLSAPLVLDPLATKEYYIPEADSAGGSGANFIIRWSSAVPVNAPIVECVMIGVKSGQGVSFTSRAQELTDTRR